jgi:hypothetical protein
MSTVGTLVRDPGIVPLPTTNTILRGQLVSFAVGAAGADGNARVAGSGDRIYGIALSDSDVTAPGLNYVPVAIKGGYTISMTPDAGQVFQQGTVVYQGAANFQNISAVVTASKVVGWAVSGKPDALGNIEVAFFTDLQA